MSPPATLVIKECEVVMVRRNGFFDGFPGKLPVVVLALLAIGCGGEDPSNPEDQTWRIPNEGPGAEAYTKGLEYANLEWVCGPENLTASCSSSYNTTVALGPQVGVCYDWGGYMTIEQFLLGISNGYGAGSSPEDGVLACTVGVDASGFICQVWGVGHYTTYNLDAVGRPIEPADISVGDIWYKEGYHAFIQGPSVGPSTFLILHASPDSFKVLEEAVDSSFLEGYRPLRNKNW